LPVKNEVSGTTVLTPALSSEEREKLFPLLWNFERLDC
jgi:hypothetical protein